MTKRLLAAALAFLFLSSAALAQTVTTLPYAASAVADVGNGPNKVRVIQGDASVFTSQGSGTGSTVGSSTALTLTGTPATAPCVGCLISGSGVTSGTTVAAYDGTTGVTLSAAMTVAGGTSLAWGAACPASAAGIPTHFAPASAMADYLLFYTQARICAVSPGGPANTLLTAPIFYDSVTPGTPFADPSATAGPAAVNGSATTAMRSDAAPAVRLASVAQSGLMPQWSGTTTTFFRGDGTFTSVGVSALSGLGTGVATALGVNTGSAGAFVVNGGALGTPSSGTLTSATGLPISTGLTGAGTGVLTALGVNVGTAGSVVVNGGALGTPSSGVGTNITGLPLANITGFGTGVATALAVNVGSAGAPAVFNGALGTPSSATLTNATGLPIATGVSGLGTGVATAAAVNGGSAGALGTLFATGTKALATGAIASTTCATDTVTITSLLTTDVPLIGFNADVTAVTGYAPVTTGGLSIYVWPTAGQLNIKVCNPTVSSITPGAVTLNYRVFR